MKITVSQSSFIDAFARAAVRWLDRKTATIAFPGGIIVANF